MYVNVDVQLFWKLLLTVWKLIPHPHSSNQEECVAYAGFHLGGAGGGAFAPSWNAFAPPWKS